MWSRSAVCVAVVLALGIAPAAADDADLEADYAANVRHRLPRKLTAVVDGTLALGQLPGAVREMWRELRNDPDLEAMFANLIEQYKPRLDYAAYVGTVGDTTRYAGAAVGVEADLAAPLCRYLGGAFNGHAYNDAAGTGFAWDSRVTGCLPWGPFAIELGFLSQRDVRMGLAAPPTASGGRFDSFGVELRTRGFRWLHTGWELVVIPVDVMFIDVAPDVDGRDSNSFTIDSSVVRFVRYGAGAGGQDRVVEGLPVRVSGFEDLGRMFNTNVVSVGAVAWQGARFSPSFFLDGNAMFQQGSISTTNLVPEPDVVVTTGAVDLSFHALIAGVHGIAHYERGLLPDDEFRLLVEDRGELSAEFRTRTALWHGKVFAAYTRTVVAPDGVAPRAAAGTYGAKLQYGRALFGPVYLSVRGEAARSFYASAGQDVLLRPALEVRGTLGVAASWSTGAK